MNISPYISLFSSILAFTVAHIIYHKNKQEKTNIIFALICLLISYVCFTEFMVKNARTMTEALIWLKIGSFWPMIPSFMLYFTLIFTEQYRVIKKQLFFYILLIPGLILSIYYLLYYSNKMQIIENIWGYSVSYSSSITFFLVQKIWIVSMILLSFTIILIYYLKTNNNKTKKQALFILLGLGIPISIFLLSRITIPLFSSALPLLTSINSTILILFFTYATWKHDLFHLTPEKAVGNIIFTLPDFFILVDEDLKIKNTNDLSLKLLDYKERELIDQPLKILFENEQLFTESTFKDMIKKDFIKNSETSLLTKKGKKIPILFSGSIIRDYKKQIIGIVIVAKDITIRKKAEKKLKKAYENLKKTEAHLIHSEKMAGIGQLSAGVAHEINNPTSFIINNLGVLKQYTGKLINMFNQYEPYLKSQFQNDKKVYKKLISKLSTLKKEIDFDFIADDLPELMQETKEGAERIKKIVSNLKSFAHPVNDQSKKVDLNQELDKAVSLVWNEIKYNCDIRKDYQKLPLMFCNPGQLNQVFVNLIVNASHAIGKTNGIISLRTQYKNKTITLEIQDNGKGISQVNQKKIFEPFFTTKSIGSGTGLGLSISYSIIKNHKGNIEVKSQKGKGTTFKITFPDRE